MSSTDPLAYIAHTMADVLPEVDATAAHERWQPGLGAFEERRQIELLVEAVREHDEFDATLSTEVPYPDSGQRCDLVLETAEQHIPIEVKLLRFRRDNGDLESAAYATIFSPFSNSLVRDARKLADANFAADGGLLGIYYEPAATDDANMDAVRLAEKVCLDVEYWFGETIVTQTVADFTGLRHPAHQQGAVIAWIFEN